MTTPEHSLEELHRRIHLAVSAIIDADSAPHDAKELTQLLLGSAEARRVYFEYMRDTNLIRNWAAQPPSERFVTLDVNEAAVLELLEVAEEEERAAEEAEIEKRRRAELLKRRQAAAQEKTREYHPPRIIEIPMPVVYGGIAAIIALVIVGVRYWADSLPGDRQQQVAQSQQEPAPEPLPLASLERVFETERLQYVAEDARRERQRIDLEEGQRLYAGQYFLPLGIIEITYDSGASSVIEGPATFSIQSARHLELSTGSLVAHVPERAVGFSVDVPSASIVDLGTEFAVSVNERSTADIHVIDGKVALEAFLAHEPSAEEAAGTPERKRQVLVKGQARKVDPTQDTVQEIPFDRAGFVRSLDGLVARDLFDTDGRVTPIASYRKGLGFRGNWKRSALEFKGFAEAVLSNGGVQSQGTGDIGYHRLLSSALDDSTPVFFSAEFQIDGDDPVCSAWVALFQDTRAGDDRGENRAATVGITDGKLSARLMDVSIDEEQRMAVVKERAAFRAYTPGEKHLMVGKLEFDAEGDKDRLSVWVDPVPGSEPGTPDKVVTGDLGYRGFDTVAVRFWDMDDGQSTGLIDNVRVSTTWQSVQ